MYKYMCNASSSHLCTMLLMHASLVFVALVAQSRAQLFEDGVKQVTVSTSKVSEASGLAASRQHTDRIWIHNDSGDQPRVVAVSLNSGVRRGMLTFSGANNKDWEDMAVGKGPNNDYYIYVVESGYTSSNLVILYRVKEPSSLSTATVKPDVLRIHWPTTRECEAVMVDERGNVYLISLAGSGQQAVIYRVPSSGWNSGNKVNLMEAKSMPVVTSNAQFPRGADISPDGREILMTDHGRNYYWKRRSGESVINAVTSRNPLVVPNVYESLRESIAWSHDSKGYYTISEGSGEDLHYFARGDSTKPVVDPGNVVTKPDRASGDRLTFVGLGDWGKPGSSQRAVADKMADWAKSNNAEFVLALGDNFYENGITSYSDSQVDDTWRKVYDQSSLKKPWYVIVGNHDHRYDRANHQIELGRRDSRWYFPKLYYSFYKQAGSQRVHFIMIDTQTGRSGSDKTQLNWFKNELRNSRGDWIIVCGHHPVFSTGPHGRFSSTRGMYQYYRPLMEQYKVALYIAGHDHNLQHLAKPSSSHIVDYVISGSGSKLYSEDSQAVRDVKDKGVKIFLSKKQYGFTGFEIQGNYVTVTYVDKYGKKVYDFTKKNPK